jgi:hypothetical protein
LLLTNVNKINEIKKRFSGFRIINLKGNNIGEIFDPLFFDFIKALPFHYSDDSHNIGY